jgi:hypothetical protein
LRLVIDHPDMCLRLVEALRDARNRLIEHLHAKSSPDPEMSQGGPVMTAPITG